MKNIYILCGVQGSGKSTYAKNNKDNLKARIVSTDQIRKDYPLKEIDVFPKAFSLIKEYLSEGYNVIFDATNINKEKRKENLEGIFSYVNRNEVKLICICLNTNKDLCKERVNLRNNLANELYLPLNVIDNYFSMFEKPTLEEGFDEIIFLDGEKIGI